MMRSGSHSSEYVVELNQLELKRLQPIRTTWDAIIAVMQAIEWFSTYPVQHRIPRGLSNYCVYSRSLKRLFTSIDITVKGKALKQIRSFSMPFRCSEQQDGGKLLFCLQGRVIDAKTCSTVINVCTELGKEELDLSGIPEYVVDNCRMDLFESVGFTGDSASEAYSTYDFTFILDIITLLIRDDISYLRFDDDPEHERPGVHPRHHVDLFYSKQQSIKIAMGSETSFRTLRDFVDQNTNAFVLNPPA